MLAVAMTTIDPTATAESTPAPADEVVGDPATKAFSTSILISATRCMLTYVVFPWLLPLIGIAGGVGPAIGITVGVIAIVFNVLSIRRFWKADHRWKWQMSTLNSVVIVMLLVLIALDIADL